MAKKSARSKGYRRQNVKKPYLSKRDIGILCAVLVLLGVGAFFLFRYDDGALKVQNGLVMTEGDNWLIADGSNVRGRSRYFRLGEIDEIDGYARQKGALTDVNVPQYTFTPAAEGDDSTRITVTARHMHAADMAEYTLQNSGEDARNTMGEIQTLEVNGGTAHYYLYTTAPADSEAEDADAATGETAEDAGEAEAAADETRYVKSLAGYIDAPHDCCLVIVAQSMADSADACLSDEQMTALLEQAADAIRLDTAEA